MSKYSDEDKEIIRELFKNAFGLGYDESYINGTIIPDGEQREVSIKQLLSENCKWSGQDDNAIAKYAEQHNMSVANFDTRITSRPGVVTTASPMSTETQISAYSYNDDQEKFIREILEKNTIYDSEQIDGIIGYGENNNLSVEELLNKYANNWEGNISQEDNAVNQLLETKPESEETADAAEQPNGEDPTNEKEESPLTFAKFDVPSESFVDKDAVDIVKKLDTDELEELNGRLKKISNTIDAWHSDYDFEILFNELNNETRTKISYESGIDGAMFKANINDVLEYWTGCLSDICYKIDKSIKKAIGANAGTGPAGSGTFQHLTSGGGGGSNKAPETSLESIVGAVGSLTFTTIAPLYETLGATSTIQSSLTGNYDVVGIYLYDNKYFYKIYDKDLKKYYYAEINNTTSFTTQYTQVLKMNEEAMLMTSTKIGDNVLTKYSNPDAVYFVKGTIEDNNINFALITDSSDNKDYYVPLSSSVELVSLEDFTKGLSANLTISQDEIIETVG